MNTAAIVSNYDRVCAEPSDINEHVPTLRALASDPLVHSIKEMGVRSGVSTWAYLRALMDKPAGYVYSLTGYDLDPAPGHYASSHVDDRSNVHLSFQQGDVLKAAPASCDLLFIDTLHVYGQLKRELALHAPGTRRFIALHDTTVDEFDGEVIRMGLNVDVMEQFTGMPKAELLRGLWPAVEEFLAANPDWELKTRYVNNNGLTVLERKHNILPPVITPVPYVPPVHIPPQPVASPRKTTVQRRKQTAVSRNSGGITRVRAAAKSTRHIRVRVVASATKKRSQVQGRRQTRVR